MKKAIALAVTVVMLLCSVAPISILAADYTPSQDSRGYYQLSTVADISWFNDYVNTVNQSVNVVLCNDINLNSVSQSSSIIGTVGKAFKGIFDGQGYSITGLRLKANASSVGFFHTLDGATVKNFTLYGEINDESQTPSYLGSLTARAKGGATVSDVTIDVLITENDAAGHIGGIIGSTEGLGSSLTIERCVYYGIISAPRVNDCIGGILGYANENVYIRNCASIGSIYNSETSSKLGGILGYINNSSFKELSGCYADMSIDTVSGHTQYGGIIGWLRSAGSATINNNVCNTGIAPYGKYTASTFTAEQVSSWQTDVASYLNGGTTTENPVWVQSLGMNNARPVLRSSLPDCDLVLTCSSGLPNYNFDENGVLTLLGGGTYTLKMKSGVSETNDRLVISNSSAVTLNLDNVNINCLTASGAPILVSSSAQDVTFNLIGTNKLLAGPYCAGLQNESNSSLSIGGTGRLAADGVDGGAGIGGGNGMSCGNITITGGEIYATGDTGGAGIGGGNGGSSGKIIITGGNVVATGAGCSSYESGAGIGGGANGSGGEIVITGGVVLTSSSLVYGPGIGDGTNGSGGTFSTGTNGNAIIFAGYSSDWQAYITDQSYKTKSTTRGIIFDEGLGKVYGDYILTDDATIYRGNNLEIPVGTTLTIPSGVTLTNDGVVTEVGDLINNGTINGLGAFIGVGTPVAYLDETGAQQECSFYAELTTNFLEIFDYKLQPGWYIVSGDVASDETIKVVGDVHIILTDRSTLSAKNSPYCGIYVSGHNSLSVYAQSTGDNMGSIDVAGRKCGSGIGGAENGETGKISINGGNILVNGAYEGSGIGNGKDGYGSEVVINGGIVDVSTGSYGAAIGGGRYADGGKITINGGTVTANALQYGAGIGGGDGGAGGDITINGGIVTANGSGYGDGAGAGIGGGSGAGGGKITINGGTVTANGVICSTGIGGGSNSDGGEITLNGGTISATGGRNAAGIGGGSGGRGGNITVTGGDVHAYGGQNAAGIGGGYRGNGGTITISGGFVEAFGNGNYGIGAGSNGGVGTFSTGENGHAVIITKSISDRSGKASWNGVIIENSKSNVSTTAEFNASKKTIKVSDKGVSSLQDLFILSDANTCSGTASLSTGATERYGTGSVVNFCDENGVVLYSMTLIVDCDINGDSYVDALDVVLLERAVNGHSDISAFSQYAFDAADQNASNAIDASDYTQLVNAALCG